MIYPAMRRGTDRNWRNWKSILTSGPALLASRPMIPLEDSFSDVIGKAQRGVKLSDDQLCTRATISSAELARAKSGEVTDETARKLASALHLGPKSLLVLARKAWQPKPAPAI